MASKTVRLFPVLRRSARVIFVEEMPPAKLQELVLRDVLAVHAQHVLYLVLQSSEIIHQEGKGVHFAFLIRMLMRNKVEDHRIMALGHGFEHVALQQHVNSRQGKG